MYPYQSKLQWFAASRYGHLIRALGRRQFGAVDQVLTARLRALRVWNQARFLILVFLSIGLASTVGAWIARYLPDFQSALDAVNQFATLSGTISGVLTLAYLFLTRLLGQLEIDILTILTVDYEKI